MRPLLILFTGCLPLAVLTVWSFVELRAIDDQLGSPNPSRNIDVATDPALNIGAQARMDKPLVVDALAEADLLSGGSLDGLEGLPQESCFKPLEDSWERWRMTREMVAKFLQLDRLTAATAASPIDQTPLEELDVARRRLESLKQAWEEAKQKYAALRQEYQDSSAKPPAEFLSLLDARIAHADRQIHECDKRLEAAELLSDARGAFQPQKYGECVALCDKLLPAYTSVLGPSVAGKVSVLRERAQFRDDAERLFSQLEDAAIARREGLLEDFLAKYNNRASPTEEEQAIVKRCQQQLREVKAELQAAAANRAAERLIQELEQNPPAGFDDRLRSTVQIVQSYPTDTVKITLRGNARQWLREFLPEKQINEPAQLKEAETTRQEIVRGFFAEVVAQDGTLFGFKRYPTLEALNDPSFDVGTYRKEEFRVPPGESVPRRCVRQYNQARNRLIEDPIRRPAWVELGDLCGSLEAELRDYRKKKGASQDDPQLSFEREGRFVRQLLAGSGWVDMQTLFGP